MRLALPFVVAPALVFTLPAACGSEEEGPLFPGAEGEGGGGEDPSGNGGAGGAAQACDPAMGATPCDTCVHASCCGASLACEEGTACDALWACARQNGCLGSSTNDFDTCVVSACPAEATAEAVSALEALSACIRASCGAECGS
jgi:hypothetical protein